MDGVDLTLTLWVSSSRFRCHHLTSEHCAALFLLPTLSPALTLTPWTSPRPGQRTCSLCSLWAAWSSTGTLTTSSTRMSSWPSALQSSCQVGWGAGLGGAAHLNGNTDNYMKTHGQLVFCPALIMPGIGPGGRAGLGWGLAHIFPTLPCSHLCPHLPTLPGIAYSEDKLLQTRIFSYADTQRHRLGPNYLLLPVNAPK